MISATVKSVHFERQHNDEDNVGTEIGFHSIENFLTPGHEVADVAPQPPNDCTETPPSSQLPFYHRLLLM